MHMLTGLLWWVGFAGFNALMIFFFAPAVAHTELRVWLLKHRWHLYDFALVGIVCRTYYFVLDHFWAGIGLELLIFVMWYHAGRDRPPGPPKRRKSKVRGLAWQRP